MDVFCVEIVVGAIGLMRVVGATVHGARIEVMVPKTGLWTGEITMGDTVAMAGLDTMVVGEGIGAMMGLGYMMVGLGYMMVDLGYMMKGTGAVGLDIGRGDMMPGTGIWVVGLHVGMGW